MTDPAEGAPTPPPSGNLEAPPPPAASVQAPPPPASSIGTPPPPSGNWQAPPPATGGFQTKALEPGPAPGIAYADLVTRIIALIIDAVILGLIQFLLGIIGVAITVAGAGWLVGLLFAILWTVVSVGYFVYAWTSMRASPGQKLLKLETVNAADGATVTQNQAIRRWAFLYGPVALANLVTNLPGFFWFFGGLIGLAAIVYAIYLLYSVTQSSKGQGYHDLQAGTVVIKHV
jgi:uncharacterized RDD family membrane protein YckC